MLPASLHTISQSSASNKDSMRRCDKKGLSTTRTPATSAAYFSGFWVAPATMVMKYDMFEYASVSAVMYELSITAKSVMPL